MKDNIIVLELFNKSMVKGCFNFAPQANVVFKTIIKDVEGTQAPILHPGKNAGFNKRRWHTGSCLEG